MLAHSIASVLCRRPVCVQHTTTDQLFKSQLIMSAPRLLYYAPRSAPSRTVLMVARYLKVDLELKLVRLDQGEHKTPEFLKLNPAHTIPVLDDGGTVISDSHAICAYLSEKYATNDQLYPKDLQRRGLVDARMHFDSGLLFGRIRFLTEPILYFRLPEVPRDRIEYIQSTYPRMENFFGSAEQPYMCGDQLTLADFCCVASLSSVGRMAPVDATATPRLAAWVRRMEALPFYAELNAPGAAELQNTLLARVEANRLSLEAENKGA